MLFSGVWQYRKPGGWLLAVFIPLLIMFGFETYTRTLYGRGLFLDAFMYANVQAPRGLMDYFDNTLIGLSFLGGCFPVALLLTPLIGGRLLKLLVSIFAVGVLALTFHSGGIGPHSFISNGVTNTSLIIQFCVFSLAGICLVMVFLKEVKTDLTHDSAFLLLWFFGVFVFVCYLNWTVNARSFILLTPAVGILLSRRIEEWTTNFSKPKKSVSLFMIGIAGLIAVATTHADYALAGSAREAAREIMSKYNSTGIVWFQGHWGFQYYMEKAEGQPVDFKRNDIRPGEIMVLPNVNSSILRPNHEFELLETMKFPNDSFMAIMSPQYSAGFYSSIWGALPYSLAISQKEVYYIYRKK